MLSRAMRLQAAAALVCALPVAAQRTGTIEVGGFARYVDFDNTLPMGDDMDIGGGGGGGFQAPGPLQGSGRGAGGGRGVNSGGGGLLKKKKKRKGDAQSQN